jgi:two-component system response regulator WspF
MDLVMPGLNGVEATREIMRHSPCPVLVVTASLNGNYDLVIRAMGAGALDAVETPVLGPDGSVQHGEKLAARLEKLSAALTDESWSGTLEAYRIRPSPADLPPLVLVGASTGGPEALAVVLAALPANFPAAVVVAQHIGSAFASGLVQQLTARSRLPVRAARQGEAPAPGTVLVAATDDHLEVTPECQLSYTPVPRNNPYRPSVNVLFASAGACWPRLGVGVVLTGMGNDGASGLLRLRGMGWHTIAQDPPTCVVETMPRAAIEKGAAAEVLPLAQIGPTIAARVLTALRV